MLSMQGRIVLVRHILCAILIYHLMVMMLNKEGFDVLEQIYREFIWCRGKQGHPKIALVVWDVIAQQLLDGGLGILQFQKHTQLLKLGCVSQPLESLQSASPIPSLDRYG